MIDERYTEDKMVPCHCGRNHYEPYHSGCTDGQHGIYTRDIGGRVELEDFCECGAVSRETFLKSWEEKGFSARPASGTDAS